MSDRYKIDITIVDQVTRDTVYQSQDFANKPFGCAAIMRHRGAELGQEDWALNDDFPHGQEMRFNEARTLEQHRGAKSREGMVAADPFAELDPRMHINAPPIIEEREPDVVGPTILEDERRVAAPPNLTVDALQEATSGEPDTDDMDHFDPDDYPVK